MDANERRDQRIVLTKVLHEIFILIGLGGNAPAGAASDGSENRICIEKEGKNGPTLEHDNSTAHMDNNNK